MPRVAGPTEDEFGCLLPCREAIRYAGKEVSLSSRLVRSGNPREKKGNYFEGKRLPMLRLTVVENYDTLVATISDSPPKGGGRLEVLWIGC